MGKATKAKQEKAEAAELNLQARLWQENAKQTAKEKAQRRINPVESICAQLLPYTKYFLKDPTKYELKTKSKDKSRQTLEVARYAFAKYPVCKPLTSVWFYPTDKTRDLRVQAIKHNFDFTLWYICVAQGGSLYKQHAKEHMTKKEVHNFVTCPHDITIDEALRYAIAKAVTTSEGLALRIAKSKLNNTPFDDFWRTVIRFFAINPPESIAQINDLVDFINAKHTEMLRPGQYPFTMAGQTLEGLIKKKIDWHYALRRIKVMGSESWEGVFIPDKTFETVATDGSKETVYWKFHQIKNAKELAAEGNRMRHCVYSYKEGCRSGRLSIWTLSKQHGENGLETPKITIELRNDGYISQARGLANRAVRPEEASVIAKWCSTYGLSGKNYY